MKKSRFSEAQIVAMLRQQEQGQTLAQIGREHSIREATFCAWKNKFTGLSTSKLQLIKQLKNESRRLKQLYAELSLENQVVKEVLRKK